MIDNQPSFTQDYYRNHATAFAEATFSLDVDHLYDPFLRELPKGGRVLDAGCGSGRDALAFQNAGFEVAAFDASPELASWAQNATGIEVTTADFCDFSSSIPFDGIWACASLLHLSGDELRLALSHLSRLLVPNGVIYASFKLGSGSHSDGEREFFNLDEESAERLLADLAELKLIRAWVSKDLRPSRSSERWLNLLAKRVG